LKLSVVILNYNVQDFLHLCLKSVEKALKSIDSEIIVVDNKSSDGSCEMIKHYFPHVKLIENPSNDGFSKGNNLGVAQASGEYLCILNPDTVVAEDIFEQLLKFAQTKDDLGIIGCRLIDGKGQFLPESKRNVPLVKIAFQKVIGNSKQYYANDIDELDIGQTPILVGAFMFLKRSVYTEVGGFDEDYFMYGEDIDLSYKIFSKGYTNYYFGKATAIHFKGESTLKDATYAKRFYGAMQLFYKKHFRQNIFFDGLVWLGIKLAYLSRKTPTINSSNPEKYLLVSNHPNQKLSKLLKKPLEVNSKIDKVRLNTEIIFDTKHVSYKDIITYMSDASISSQATFKILPENVSFIIGSNDSRNRGEVLKF